MLIIGFGHRARQGKDTSALAILNATPLECFAKCYSFGDALKAEVRRACAASGGAFALVAAYKEAGLMPDWAHAEADGKQRSLLQWWGTDYRRAKDPDYWVKKLAKQLEHEQPEVALITDVRFPNEVEAVKQWGGYVVKVTRTTAPDVIVNEHASEAALDGYRGWDFVLESASLDECRAKAVALYKDLA